MNFENEEFGKGWACCVLTRILASSGLLWCLIRGLICSLLVFILRLCGRLLKACEYYFCLLSRYSITKAFCIAFVLTFFSIFDVPVFWPILLFYWVMLCTLMLRKQILHMMKYKYLPFSSGKQVICDLPCNSNFYASTFYIAWDAFLFLSAVWRKERILSGERKLASLV